MYIDIYTYTATDMLCPVATNIMTMSSYYCDVYLALQASSINKSDWSVCDTTSQGNMCCSSLMQQMSSRHSTAAMNNCDNHCTMASFISGWRAAASRPLGRRCFPSYEEQRLFSPSVRQACLQSDVTGDSSAVCVCAITDTKSGTQPCKRAGSFLGGNHELTLHCIVFQWGCTARKPPPARCCVASPQVMWPVMSLYEKEKSTR